MKTTAEKPGEDINPIQAATAALSGPDWLTQASTGQRLDVPAIAMINPEDCQGPADLRGEIIVQDGVTVGVILMAKSWQRDPEEAGKKLAVPPDETGWMVLDWMEQSGVEHVEIRTQ